MIYGKTAKVFPILQMNPINHESVLLRSFCCLRYILTEPFLVIHALVSEEPLDTTLTSTSSCPPGNWFDSDVESMETTEYTSESLSMKEVS